MSTRGATSAGGVGLALALAWGGGACAEADERPNFVLILVDTLRADYLGAYGFDGDISPNVDRLAAESVVFENCLSQAPWTKPSIASLFTSTYPRVHQLTNHEGMFWSGPGEELQTGILASEHTTLAEAFGRDGYRTGAFVANPWIVADFGFGQGFELYHDEAAGRATPGDVILRAAREWIEGVAPDGPFFAYVHLMDVHDPFDAPDADAGALLESRGLGADRELEEPPPEYLSNRPQDDSASLRFWRSRYAAGVRVLDRRLGSFLDALERSGVLDESYLLFTSDHGEELFEHGGWAHGYSLRHHQVHVPLIVRPPGGVGGGRRIADLVQTIDLMPTLLALAGVGSPPNVQGRDVSALLRAGRRTGAGSELRLGHAPRARPVLRSHGPLHPLRRPGDELRQALRSGLRSGRAAQPGGPARGCHGAIEGPSTRPSRRDGASRRPGAGAGPDRSRAARRAARPGLRALTSSVVGRNLDVGRRGVPDYREESRNRPREGRDVSESS